MKNASTIWLFTALLLQLVALTTPGWYVTKYIWDKQFQGIFYIVTCTAGADGECKTQSIPAFFDDLLTGRLLYWFVSTVFNVIITLVLTAAAFIMRVQVHKQRQKWTPSYTAVSVTILSIANTLQWQIVADFGNMSAVDHPDPIGTHVSVFPWCVFFHGVGAFIVSFVILCDLATLLSSPAVEVGRVMRN